MLAHFRSLGAYYPALVAEGVFWACKNTCRWRRNLWTKYALTKHERGHGGIEPAVRKAVRPPRQNQRGRHHALHANARQTRDALYSVVDHQSAGQSPIEISDLRSAGSSSCVSDEAIPSPGCHTTFIEVISGTSKQRR